MDSDEKLLRGIISGDVASFELLFKRYYPRLHKFVNGMLKDYNAAEDVAQDIFMKLWQNRHFLDTRKSVKNYLFVLARNEILDILKSKYNTSVKLHPNLTDDDKTAVAYKDVSDYVGVGAIIRNEIGKLPPKRREVFILSRYMHLSNAEIAEKCNLSVRTVEKHIELALKDLQKGLN